MIDLDSCQSLADAVRAATETFANETCLIEANRDRENARLTYAEYREQADALAAGLQSRGFAPGDRAAIIMTNQSKWLISGGAVFFAGGVLVPLDYKLSGDEHIFLIKHSRASVLVIEYHLWRAIASSGEFDSLSVKTVLVTDAPNNADLFGAMRWEDCKSEAPVEYKNRSRDDDACIVYSSGTGGDPKGCVLTHGVYLTQCKTLMHLYRFDVGDRYLSVLPTNHAIDFMVGFVGPFVCGATVVHLRSLRPEFIKQAFTKYKISYMALVPMVLKNLRAGLQNTFAELSPAKSAMLKAAIGLNRMLTKSRPKLTLSRKLLSRVHQGFGGNLKAFFVGGAFTEPDVMQFFYDLGIPVANGYGLTEAGTAITLNDLAPFRADTVGKPLPGVELKINDADEHGVGEVVVRSQTLMSRYLDDPEQTSQVLRDGWLHTGDLGRIDATGHLQLFGRRKNMIVTAGGKNVYPEDIENAFSALAVQEYCVFAYGYLWPTGETRKESLVIVLHLEKGQSFDDALLQRLQSINRRIPDYKRISEYLLWSNDFERTASMKIKRNVLAKSIAADTAGPTGEVAS
ncbi:MAG TPA: AMP-binding protein [Phycisphaerae bacterium]|nr:AMP-binding protein [Phycisphaerae bacterium]